MSISELNTQFVYYQGDMNSEYVRIEVEEDCNLGRFLVMDNTYNQDGSKSNKYRHVYHFPKIPVYAGDTIFLYTKEGENDIPKYDERTNRYISLYWNLGKSIWNKDGDTLHIIKIAASESKRII